MGGHRLTDVLSDLAARIRTGGGPCPLCADHGPIRVSYPPGDLRPSVHAPDCCARCGHPGLTVEVVYRDMTGPDGIYYRKNGEDDDD